MAWLASLRPLPALAVVLGVLLAAGLLGGLVDDHLSLSVMSTTASLAYLCWPFSIGMVTSGRATDWKWQRLAASFALPFVIAFHAVAGIWISGKPQLLTAFEQSLFVSTWLVALTGTAYLMWFGASALVAAEHGRRLPFNQCVGTFLAFLFLPFGVVFLQRRVRRVRAIPV